MKEEEYMRRAIALAKKAVGHTNPNPMVGAVIVKDGRIIGEGYHQQIGGLHAERNALASCRESAEGATIYVTLEPCCHYGKTPPCTEAIIEHKLAKVVIGSKDPNPKVAGKGVASLRAAGIEVVEDFLREECDAINPVFFQYIREKQPYVALKYAMTADGKIAANSGASQWITGEGARAHVHWLRNYYKGIMVGIGTVLADNPTLTCRMSEPMNKEYGTICNESGGYGRNPVRIVCDSRLRLPMNSNLCNTVEQAPIIVACLSPEDYGKIVTVCPKKEREKTAEGMQEQTGENMQRRAVERGYGQETEEYEQQVVEKYKRKASDLEAKGIQVLYVREKNGHIDMADLLSKLGQQDIDGILVEGGGQINAALIEAGLVHHIYAYIGAQIFGGINPYTPVSGAGIEVISDSLQLQNPKVQIFGNDVLIEYDRKI